MRSAELWSWPEEMDPAGIKVEATNDTGLRTSSVPWVKVSWQELDLLVPEGKTLRVEGELDDGDVREEVPRMYGERWEPFFTRVGRHYDRFAVEVVDDN